MICRMNKLGMVVMFMSLMFLMSGCGELYGEAEEMKLKETLIFGGIDADVHYTDETVNVLYSLDVENEEDVLMSVFYVFGACSEIFPYADLYRITYDVDEKGDVAYFYEADSFYTKQYFNGEITLEDFQDHVDSYVR